MPAFQHQLYLGEAILLVPDYVIRIDRLVLTSTWTTADGYACRFFRRVFLAGLSPSSCSIECIFKRFKTGSADQSAVALVQGWMVILLNLSCLRAIVFIHFWDEEQLCLVVESGLLLSFSPFCFLFPFPSIKSQLCS